MSKKVSISTQKHVIIVTEFSIGSVVRSERGFGIVAVMAGAVVLGIFALVYTQQMQNRANISLIGDLMSFREQVITYYGSVVSNRSTWECTIQANNDLKLYLATGHMDTTYSGPGSAGINAPDGTLNIFDYSGDCQEGFGGADGKLIVSNTGLGLKLDLDHSSLPVVPHRNCDNTNDGTHFCLKVEWERLDPDQSQQRAVEVKLVLEANRKAIKKQLDVSFDLAGKEHALYFNRTVATDCSDGRVTGYFPGVTIGQARGWTPPGPTYIGPTAPHPVSKGVPGYAGDTAVVKFDPVTGLVACSSRGPLVVPPCYDMSDYEHIGDIGTLRSTYRNPFISSGGMPGYRGFQSGKKGFGNIISNLRLQCDGSGACCGGGAGNTCPCSFRLSSPARIAVKGRCPETAGSGTTTIAYFDPQTGISQCSNPNILVEVVDESIKPRHCDEQNQYGIIQIRDRDISGKGAVGTFRCSTDKWGIWRGGVEVDKGSCGPNYALAGFNTTGKITHCAAGKGAQASRAGGFPGPYGLRGKAGSCYGSGLPGRDAIQVCPAGCYPYGSLSLPSLGRRR